ncbi:DNA mismatch repair protein [Orbilia oligospora]|nr:DNA mismatch repair protein [Orbilia oligospora]
MVTATQRLNEVVSSRACRSAIMFNDKLTLEECRELIERLAACDFPFQCAHGRPSMVPVIDLADDGVETRFKEDACGNLCFQHD